MVGGLGCGHVIAPVLEQLDRIDGVEASSANHTGTMLCFAVRSGADPEQVAQVVEKRLAGDSRQPVRLKGADLEAALGRQRWRTKERIGELTAIEFRTLALGRVKDLIRAETTAEAAGKLLSLAEAQWDRLAQQADLKEPGQLPHRTDWKRRCREFAAAFTEGAGGLLTDDQRQRFRQLLESLVRVIPDPAR